MGPTQTELQSFDNLFRSQHWCHSDLLLDFIGLMG